MPKNKTAPAAAPQTEAPTSEAQAISREALAALYDLDQVETVHLITDARQFYFAAEFGQAAPWDEMNMPEGNYIVVKIVGRPTPQPGLYALRAPKA